MYQLSTVQLSVRTIYCAVNCINRPLWSQFYQTPTVYINRPLCGQLYQPSTVQSILSNAHCVIQFTNCPLCSKIFRLSTVQSNVPTVHCAVKWTDCPLCSEMYQPSTVQSSVTTVHCAVQCTNCLLFSDRNDPAARNGPGPGREERGYLSDHSARWDLTLPYSEAGHNTSIVNHMLFGF